MATPLEQLEAMRTVPENWDGYGGAAPRPELIDAAVRFLHLVARSGPLPEPFVSPTRTGGVLFEWQQGPHQLEVEIDSRDQGSFAYLNQETGETATGTVVLQPDNGRQPFTLTAIMAALPAVPAGH